MPTAGQRIRALDFTAAAQATDSTSQTGATHMTTSYTNGSPEVAVTITAPTSGKALVHWSMAAHNPSTNTYVITSFEVRETDGSGTVVRAAGGDANSVLEMPGRTSIFLASAGKSYLMTGLTPGQVYFFRLRQRSGATSSVIGARSLQVVPLAA